MVRTAPGYALYPLGEYLAMTTGDGHVDGELWEVVDDDLSRLDEFEGGDYRREHVALEDGSIAFAYFARGQGT